MFDTHVHTKFSPDGKSGMKEYITLLDEGCLEGLGFSEHLDFMPCCGGYEYLDDEAYLSEVNCYKQMGYKVYAGVEVDYAVQVEDEILKRLKQHSYDYSICSVHMVDNLSISDKLNEALLQDDVLFCKMLDGYYHQVASSLKVGVFDTIGHIGIYARYLDRAFLDAHPMKKRMDDLNDVLAQACAQSGKIVEVNTSGLFNAIGACIPDNTFLTAYFQYGGRQISIGSDAHQVRQVGRGFEAACRMLGEIGFRWITYPWDRSLRIPV